MTTTSRTYHGRYARHTYGRFAADASRVLDEGWVPVSLHWVDETVLDVVFERPTPVAVGEEELPPAGRTAFWGKWDDLPWFLRQVLVFTMYALVAGMIGLVVSLLVTTVLR